MLVLLLPTVFALLVVLYWRYGSGWRESLVWAALTFATVLLSFTELLSLVSALTPVGITLVWVCVGLILVWLISRSPQRPLPRLSVTLSALDKTIAALTILCLILIGIVAVASVPNTWDSMTYHMPRVMHWLENATNAPYPTAITRQIYQHPWAEYAILHLYALGGIDRLANLVQYFSLVLVLITAALIVRALGGRVRAQLLSTLLIVTIPTAVLQGTSTQNDLVVACWSSLFAYFAVRSVKEGGTRANLIGLGLSLGLALSTKATAYIYVLPFVIWAAISLLHRHRWHAGAYGAAIGALALALVLPHLIRNTTAFGAPTGPETGRYTNALFTPAALISNLSRNLALELAINDPITSTLNDGLDRLHTWLGLARDDPRTTWGGGDMAPAVNHEDRSAAPLQVLLIGLAFILYPLAAVRRGGFQREVLVYGICALFAAVGCALVLKWQPWHSRLHLPILAMAMPFTALVIVEVFARRLIIPILLLLIGSALPALFGNFSRPLIGPRSVLTNDSWSQVFSNRRGNAQLQNEYSAALEAVGDCNQVGLVINEDSWEYPFWRWAHMNDRSIDFEHLPAEMSFEPCAVLIEAPLQVQIPEGFELAQEFPPLSLYLPSHE